MAFVTAQDRAQSEYSIWVSEKGDDTALLDALVRVAAAGAKSLMILACSANSHSPHHLNAFLHSCPVPICGGVFPSVFFGSLKLDSGFIVVGFPFSIAVDCYQQISKSSHYIDQSKICDGEVSGRPRDLMVIVDAATSTAEDFISWLYESIGGGINVIGGGAGALDFQSHPCVFSRAGLLADAALIVHLPVPMQCAVDHGWQILIGPYLVTEAKGACVKTIDYMPAFEVYKGVLEEITHHRFTGDNFFDVSKNFPLGIVGINNDILVRDPIQVVDENLICVGRIPVNSIIYILCAKPSNIIRAAEQTGSRVAEKSTISEKDGLGLTVAFDCVSRALYLGQDFVFELDAVRKGSGTQQALVGVLSIGEIANTSQGIISLLNKSIVVGNL